MYHWHNEFMVEQERQEILKEVEQIRLEKLTLQSRTKRPHLFERIMFNLANWMISTGKQLRKRYKAAAINQNNSPTGSLVN